MDLWLPGYLAHKRRNPAGIGQLIFFSLCVTIMNPGIRQPVVKKRHYRGSLVGRMLTQKYNLSLETPMAFRQYIPSFFPVEQYDNLVVRNWRSFVHQVLVR